MKEKNAKKTALQAENKKKTLKDSDILNSIIESTETDYYTFGAYTDYNGLDVRNLKHPFFDKK